MAHLHLSLLGPFQAELDGRLLTDFESNKVRALLVLLAVDAAQPHPRETLAEMLWPEQPPGAALAKLRHALTNLRHLLDDQHAVPPFLLMAPGMLQINPDADVFVDLARFMALAEGEPAPSAEACREAVTLYRGPFLQGFALDGSPDFEEWQAVVREQANLRMVRTLALLAGHSISQGDYAQAVEWTRRRTVLEPWNEEAHCQLMALLAVSGRRAAALHQFSLCTQLLADQLDLQPLPETSALAKRIRAGPVDRSLLDELFGETLALSQTPVSPVATWRLPPQHTPFFGREAELELVAAKLADPHCRLLTIVGPGGVGKTRLALEAAARHASDFAHGACFVSLASVQSGYLNQAILQALRVPPQGAVKLRQQLLDHLAQKRLLLVLDNFEHLTDEAGLLAEIVEAAPQLKLLVTSRVRLNLAAEWLLPLDGLETPPIQAAGLAAQSGEKSAGEDWLRLERYSAIQLYLHAVRRVQPGYAPGPADGPPAASICRLLDGIPLAIELAAGWVRVMGAPATLAHLERSLDLLETSARDVPPRHRSMRAVSDHSWSLLTSNEQRALRHMAVFRGTFSAEAARTVADATLIDIAQLLDKSWLRSQPGGRYDLHELVRQYVEEKLDAQPDDSEGEAGDEVRRRHCTYYAELLHMRVGTMNMRHAFIGEFMADYGNYMAAWQWAVAYGEWEAAQDMALTFYYAGDLAGSFRFTLHIFEQAIQTLAPYTGADSPKPEWRQAVGAILGWLHHARTDLLLALELVDEAEVENERNRALQNSLAPDNSRTEKLLVASEFGAWLAFHGGQYGEARRRFRALLRRFRTAQFDYTLYGIEAGALFWQAHAEAALARMSWVAGRYRIAQQRMRRAFALRERIGEQRFRANNLAGYAQMLLATGDLVGAGEAGREALRLSETFGDVIGVAGAHRALGWVEATAGNYTAAQVHFDQSEATGRRSGNLVLLMESLTGLGRAELALGHADAAKALFEDALHALAALGAGHCNAAVGATLGLGWAALAQDDLPAAQSYFEQVPRMTGCVAWEKMDAAAGLGLTDLQMGRPDEANERLTHVLCQPATAYETRRCIAEARSALDDAAGAEITGQALAAGSPV